MKEGAKIAALIVAAGYSSRMGRLKPLLPLGRSTVLEEAVKCFRGAGIRDVTVVVGHMAEAIVPLLDDLGVEWVLNERYHLGMLSSILAGVKGLAPDFGAFFLLPVDVPLVKPETIDALVRAYRMNPGRIVYPRFRGLRGHPPLIQAGLVPGDLPPDYEGGLRAFLAGFEALTMEVDVADEGVLMDCDTPEDYEKIRARFLAKEIPTREECRALWDRFETSEETRTHCELVAELARLFAVHLNRSGFNLDVDLVTAAGRLHDIARAQAGHAAAGARLLEDLGYPQVAKIVARHMDLEPGEAPLDETDLIYLADKCVARDRVISLEERFAGSRKKFSGDPEAAMAVSRRLKNAETLRERLEAAVGISLERILQRYGRSIRAVAVTGEKEIYLVRHGAVRLPSGGRRFIGQTDVPLSEEGIRQANDLRETFLHVNLSAVFCSDLMRCAETAHIVSEPHGIVPVGRRDLREIFLGRWEGLTFEEVSSRHPEEFKARGLDIVNYRPPDGESFMDCAGRVIPAFFDMLRAAEGNILVVGHAGVNRILLCQAMGMSLERLFEIEQGYGCLNVIHCSGPRIEIMTVNRSPCCSLP